MNFIYQLNFLASVIYMYTHWYIYKMYMFATQFIHVTVCAIETVMITEIERPARSTTVSDGTYGRLSKP